MLKRVIGELAEFVAAIGVYSTFVAAFDLRPDLYTSLFIFCCGALVWLVIQLESLDDRWK